MENIEVLPKRIHVIGICGVAMSALAIAFHKKGIHVTGSDKGFWPPVSTELEKQGVTFYAGWHPEKMVEGGRPDIIIVGTASGSQNPETLYAKENNIPMYSYPEVIGKYFAKVNSLICSGTWGKTSSAALLSFILEKASLDPSYMFGGVSLSHLASAKLTDSEWSVFEGDEYKSSPTDKTAKFFYYKPTHLLLTAVSWDHADLYPTEEDYFATFQKLLTTIPAHGLVVYQANDKGINKIITSYKGKSIRYGGDENDKTLDFYYHSVKQSQNGLAFTISHKNQSWEIVSPMIGLYQAENITGCFAMAHTLGINPALIVQAILIFQGLRRRLEKRLDMDESNKNITVFDDIAHSPEKALSVLKTLRSIYKGKIYAIFEPNIGGRERASAKKYDRAFNLADHVFIPRLTKLKQTENEKDTPMEGDELSKVIAATQKNTEYIPDDDRLVERLVAATKPGDVIVFLGSHGFRNMIEQVVSKLKN